MTKSEQSRADALADGETYRTLLVDVAVGDPDTNLELAKSGCFDGYQNWAVAYAIQRGYHVKAAQYATRAARAAFRAVPGLRGDK